MGVQEVMDSDYEPIPSDAGQILVEMFGVELHALPDLDKDQLRDMHSKLQNEHGKLKSYSTDRAKALRFTIKMLEHVIRTGRIKDLSDDVRNRKERLMKGN